MYFCQLSKDTVLKVQISEKVLKDLEFTTILDQVAEYSISELGRQKILQIKPIENRADLLEELRTHLNCVFWVNFLSPNTIKAKKLNPFQLVIVTSNLFSSDLKLSIHALVRSIEYLSL